MPDVPCPALNLSLGGWGDLYIGLALIKELRILLTKTQGPCGGSKPGSKTSDVQRCSGGFLAQEASLCMETQTSGLARCMGRIHWDLVTPSADGASILRGRIWPFQGDQSGEESSGLTLIPTNRALLELWVPGGQP